MPNVDECSTLSGWVAAGWPILLILMFFSFSGGYIICALARAASDNYRGNDHD